MPFPMSQHDSLMASIRQHLMADETAAAIPLLHEVLQHHPDDAVACGLLGRCLRLTGAAQEAQTWLERSLQRAPGLHASRLELALLARARGDEATAATLLQTILKAEPQHFLALLELADLEQERQPQQAAEYLMQAVRQRPGDVELVMRTGHAMRRAQRFNLAAEAFSHAARLRPDRIEAWFELGCCLLPLGQPADALHAFAQVLQRDPNHLDALLGSIDAQPSTPTGQAESLRLMQRVCALDPSAQRFFDLSGIYYNLGRNQDSLNALDKALALDPDHIPARWRAFQLPAQPSPASEAASDDFIARWRAGLAYFEQRVATHPRDPRLSQCPALASAFWRHYLPEADADQPRYGRLLRHMVEPDHPDAPAPPARAKPRIAIVSAHLRWHTVSRLFAPLLTALDSTQMDIELLAISVLDPRWRKHLEGTRIRIHNRHVPAPAWADLLHQLQPDCVLYLDVGMEASTQWLAAQRFAPVQATLWGHPITTGLPSMDFFLSPDAMEPDDAQTRYSETLIRLPGFGHGFQPDQTHAAHPAGDFDPDAIDLLCTQSIYKLMPEQDALFARILAALPGARLHLVPHWQDEARQQLLDRMRPALRAAGADPDTQIVMHPLLDFEAWLSLAARCRLHLDSLHFSGGMSSFDLCAIGLPAITLPGPTMRSRQTAAMLQAMDLPELIADSADDYVEKTVTLARDAARCRTLAPTLRDRSACLWQSHATVQALNQFLLHVTRR